MLVTFKETLKQQMELKGFKMKTLSEKAGLDSSAIRKILDGSSRNVRLDTFVKICDALDSSPMLFLPKRWQKPIIKGVDILLLSKSIAEVVITEKKLKKRLTAEQIGMFAATVYTKRLNNEDVKIEEIIKQ